MYIPVEVSARHVHCTRADIETLFGSGVALTSYRGISQPGQFASNERLTLRGPKSEIRDVRVVGPAREQTQVELSVTDARMLGVQPEFRVSGDLAGTGGGLTLVGPGGTIALTSGVIIALRHLHIEPEYAKALGVTHLDRIAVEITGDRGVTLHNVVVRSREGIDALALHLDTDEGNAAGIMKPTHARFIQKE